ncbi:60S ribosomal protein L27a-like [Acomys russatus]|uniref:60S ribosomal protein L27a-like n=1 Tax=Acomys russatus TaxID=60746 RepID=UPI0021E1D89D|nr:60S ribosomal protein L27a-like [Acomys russatus]
MPSRLRKARKLRGHQHISKHPGSLGSDEGTHHHRITSASIIQATLEMSRRGTTAAKTKTGAAPVIDTVRWGYYKVLGKARLPKQSVIMKAKFFNRTAEEKIEGAGGA